MDCARGVGDSGIRRALYGIADPQIHHHRSRKTRAAETFGPAEGVRHTGVVQSVGRGRSVVGRLVWWAAHHEPAAWRSNVLQPSHLRMRDRGNRMHNRYDHWHCGGVAVPNPTNRRPGKSENEDGPRNAIVTRPRLPNQRHNRKSDYLTSSDPLRERESSPPGSCRQQVRHPAYTPSPDPSHGRELQ